MVMDTENLALKIRLSVLWLFWTVAFLVQMMIALFEPGVVEQIIAGEFVGLQITPELMLLFAIMMLVPLVMAFLSLIMKDLINRWANVVLGIVYTGLCLFDLIDTAVSAISAISAYVILMYISHIAASVLIVWYAYKWQESDRLKKVD